MEWEGRKERREGIREGTKNKGIESICACGKLRKEGG